MEGCKIQQANVTAIAKGLLGNLPAPAVLAMRGMSGSGKSTLAHHLANAADGSRIVSADDFFYGLDDGVYRFDLSRVPQAHAECFRAYIAALFEKTPYIVVDNTNLTAWEISPYMLGAAAFGYGSLIVEVPCDPAIAARRNIHRVPSDVLQQQSQLMADVVLPSSWRRTQCCANEVPASDLVGGAPREKDPDGIQGR